MHWYSANARDTILNILTLSVSVGPTIYECWTNCFNAFVFAWITREGVLLELLRWWCLLQCFCTLLQVLWGLDQFPRWSCSKAFPWMPLASIHLQKRKQRLFMRRHADLMEDLNARKWSKATSLERPIARKLAPNENGITYWDRSPLISTKDQ